MKWVNIKGKTTNFTKPKEWDERVDGPCGVLPVRVEIEGRNRTMSSNWLPSPEELAMLNAGGVVELLCVGIQPPVSVSVVPHYTDEG